jgi:hypothetical protein
VWKKPPLSAAIGDAVRRWRPTGRSKIPFLTKFLLTIIDKQDQKALSAILQIAH